MPFYSLFLDTPTRAPCRSHSPQSPLSHFHYGRISIYLGFPICPRLLAGAADITIPAFIILSLVLRTIENTIDYWHTHSRPARRPIGRAEKCRIAFRAIRCNAASITATANGRKRLPSRFRCRPTQVRDVAWMSPGYEFKKAIEPSLMRLFHYGAMRGAIAARAPMTAQRCRQGVGLTTARSHSQMQGDKPRRAGAALMPASYQTSLARVATLRAADIAGDSKVPPRCLFGYCHFYALEIFITIA